MGPSNSGALSDCTAYILMKLDLSVPVTGSPTVAFRSLSSAHPSPAVQEAHAGPAVLEPGPALGQI